MLAERYANIIKGQLFSHAHESYFTIMTGASGEPAGIGHINPALTPNPHLNPSFRVYEIDSETYEFLDYVEYRLNVTKANQAGKAEWAPAYRFTTFFGVKDLSLASYRHILKDLEASYVT